MKPIDTMLNSVDWKRVDCDEQDKSAGLPYVTHSGVLSIGEFTMNCYQLNDGRRIFDAKDIERFFGASFND